LSALLTLTTPLACTPALFPGPAQLLELQGADVDCSLSGPGLKMSTFVQTFIS